MRALSALAIVATCLAAAGSAQADELTADQVIDRMLEANNAWLKPDVENLSYVLTRHWNPEQTITVEYHAPDDLKIERHPSGVTLWFRGGTGFASEWSVWSMKWDADRIYDGAMQALVFRGAAWILANHRDRCQLSGFRREQMDGHDAYRLVVSGYYPSETALYFPGPVTDDDDTRYLWVDAETFRPLREAYDCAGTAEIIYCVVRFKDYRPFPGGGQAPMRLESSELPDGRPPDADPVREPDTISTYQVVDGKYWFRKLTTRSGKPDEELTEIGTAPIPAAVFDGPQFARLAQAAELHEQARTCEKERRWGDLLTVCDEILAGGLGVASVRHNAIRLHFWHGDYQKVVEIKEASKADLDRDDIYVAWAYDALGQREKALEIYREIEAHTVAGWETPEVDQGLKRPWVPIAKRLQPKDDEQLLEPGPDWRAESNTEGEHPEAAIDGDRRSCWVSADRQTGDMWFQVDLGKPTALTRVAYDFVGDLTLYDDRYPNEYRIEVSADGEQWKAVADGRGLRDNLVETAIPPQPVRYVRMTITRGDQAPVWSIHEIFFFAPRG
jgi:tetratricopeptide (TPR) repeat protein